MSKYKMTIDFQVLNHLGINLYSNTPAVISEVVANAWDADATCVDITLSGSEIVIKDNGLGMDLDDVNEKFLKVGYQKRKNGGRSQKFNRLVMGRKGIGKLSLFSIARDITILTQKELGQSSSFCKNAFRIRTEELDQKIRAGDTENYEPDALPESMVDFEGSGTKIVLRALKKRTQTLQSFLRCRLARRFSAIGSACGFEIKINGETITPEDRGYLSKAQYLWVLGSECHKNRYLKETKPSILKKYWLRSGEWSFQEKNYSISGWIATVEEPNVLKDQGESLNRIVLMVRGKMAKEDILSEFNETGLYTRYILGELSVDFLDADEEDDITTSNRQGFFEEDSRYLALKEFVLKELKNIKSTWTDERNTTGLEEASKIEVAREWFSELENDDKRIAKNLFGKINQLTIEKEEKSELIRHGILAFESLKLRKALSEFEKISPENIGAFVKAAKVLDGIESSLYYKIVKERIAVIDKLIEITDQNTLEKVVQRHLADNLWLIDPSWDRGTETPCVEKAIKTQFDTINAGLSKEEQEARLDVRYKKTSNRHVVIELKRAGRNIRFDELLVQVRKYYNALDSIFQKNKISETFEIIALIGKTAEREEIFSSADLKALKPFKTRVLFYDELIRNAQTMYLDFLNANKESNRFLRKFLEDKN